MNLDQTCVLLFGSLARGDGSSESDIDILVSSPKGRISSVKDGHAEVQYTPQDKLLEMARRGDLFAIHLAYEARIISDPSNFFQEFKSCLVIKKDYSQERRWAFSLLAYLIKRRVAHRGIQLRNKRIAWCVRTVLISLLIEEGRIIFSPRRLLNHYDEPYIGKLLSMRRGDTSGHLYKNGIIGFLKKFGGSEYLGYSAQELEVEFLHEENRVAISTINGLEKEFQDAAYL